MVLDKKKRVSASKLIIAAKINANKILTICQTPNKNGDRDKKRDAP